MNIFTKSIKILLTAMILFSFTGITKANKKDLIQMAILLDTSNSMDGLINQAKSQLWKIVNEMALAKKNGQTPNLEVAIYEYGNDSLSEGEGYIRMVAPLTSDLDKISEELFKLTTNGGSEYCGQVIDSATRGLKWSKNNFDLKLIFIAGNEPFTQGEIDYQKSCKKAITKGIIVNTIFCGSKAKGIKTKWKHGADLADGKYMNIDHNEKEEYIEAPQDKEIVRLGKQLNKTYIAYGRSGFMKKSRQSVQDQNAAKMSEESVVQRSVSKASKHYSNSGWDIVDAMKNKKVKLENMKKADLPEEMKKMNKKERKEYIEKMAKRRAELQKKINKLNIERRKYITKIRKTKANKNRLDSAIIKTIQKQAKKKSFSFK